MKTKIRERGIREYAPKCFEVYVFAEGKEVRKRLKNTTLANAKFQRSKLLTDIAEGRYAPRRRREVLFSTLCDAAEAFFKIKRRDWLTAVGRAKQMKEWWGDFRVSELKPAMIAGMFNEQMHREKRPWTQTTVHEYRAILNQIFVEAIRKDDPEHPSILVNPVSLMGRRVEVFNHRERVLSADEETKLRVDLMPEQNAILTLALHVGCRRSNLFGIDENGRADMDPLMWHDVDLKFRVVKFPRSKNYRPYTVPLNDAALAAFELLRSGTTGDGPILDTKSPRRWFTTALRNAKIADFRWNDLRHTFAQRLLNNGVVQEVRETLIGHKLKGIQYRYAKPTLEILRQAVATLDPKPTSDKTNRQENRQPQVKEMRQSA